MQYLHYERLMMEEEGIGVQDIQQIQGIRNSLIELFLLYEMN
jgi:hypothetical protein